MKKYIYLFCLSILMLSCTSDNHFISEEPTPPETDELVTLSFGCGGELVTVVTSPMTKATNPTDLYLFLFWENNGTDDWGRVEWNTYGYLFTDSPNGCLMSFRKNKNYICEALCIPDGKNLVASKGNVYGLPFIQMAPLDVNIPVLNSPYYGHFAFDFSFCGITTPKGEDMKLQPFNDRHSNQYNSVDKYFGTTRFNAEDGAKINVNFYRMMFSVTLNVTNFTEGRLVLLDKYGIFPDKVPFKKVMEMGGTPFWYLRENSESGEDMDSIVANYAHSEEFKIIYINKEGNNITIYNKSIPIQRLTNYEITFDLKQVLESDGMEFNATLNNEDIIETNTISF